MLSCFPAIILLQLLNLLLQGACKFCYFWCIICYKSRFVNGWLREVVHAGHDFLCLCSGVVDDISKFVHYLLGGIISRHSPSNLFYD
eukprot:UN15997